MRINIQDELLTRDVTKQKKNRYTAVQETLKEVLQAQRK